MSGMPFWMQNLAQPKATATLQNTYTTAKSIIHATDVFPFPANGLTVGSLLRLTARGGLSNRAATPGTVTFQIMMGSVIAWSSGALSFNASARTLLPFTLQVDLRVDTIGAGTSATFWGQGTFGGVHLTGTDQTIQVPTTAPAAGTGWDSTVANNLDLWAGFSTSDAGNGVQIRHYLLEQLG